MTKISDEKDRLILFELLQDCRQSLSKIAKAVNLPQQTVSYRIKRLEKSKVIKKYTININYSKLGYRRHTLYLDVKEISTEEVNKYIQQIIDVKEVSCCHILRDVSEWKLYISIWTKTIEEYDKIQTKILNKFKNKVNNYLSFASIKSYTYFPRRLNPKKAPKVDIKEGIGELTIKETDWKILEKLKKNSKISILDLAKELNMRAKTVVRKIDLLKKKEIIQRFYPLINPKKLGYNQYTFISRIDPSYSKEIEEFIEFTKKDPRFTIVIRAVGYVNLSYSFLVKDDEELKEILEKVEGILGKARLQNFKIEINDMVG
ncbi:MAG: Lrp/AsnC family transcriptional regulator [Nanoarchaeota archaeon]|nr:Lrp/AsnC family transcriptional regulator [Nanoarchaeota archaeon]MBU1028468.1 Lrp/AsnC family transcriptional regulator [Nanoarchaeota archaeon]